MIPSQAPELQEKSFHTGTVTLNYAEGPATGRPLVLLHGVGRNWQDFLALIPEFSRDWHVFAVDLRGHGKSGRVANGYVSEQYAEDIVVFLQNAVDKPAAVFGHSLGGVVGMRVAADLGDAVSALVVGDSVLSRESLHRSLYHALFAGLHSVLLQGGSIVEIAHRLARVEIPVPHLDRRVALGEFPGNDETYFRRWADCLRLVDPDVFAMALAGSTLADWDWKSFLPRINCPTLFLQANPDLGGLMSDAELDVAVRLLHRAQVERFPLLGHALHLQRPQAVRDAVVKFLTST